MKQFRRHFRIYFKNGHPAYIVDEDGNKYVFHRMTHSKTSGKRNNFKIDNPLVKGGNKATYIVKREERDNKGRFSLFELDIKPGINVDKLLTKKAGGSQPVGTNNLTTSINGGKLTNEALTQKGHTPSTSIKSKHKKKGKRNGQ